MRSPGDSPGMSALGSGVAAGAMRPRRDTAHSASEALPIVAIAMASGQAERPSVNPTTVPARAADNC